MLEYSRKYELKLVILLFFAWGFIFLDRSALSYIMPTLIEELNLTTGQVGQINMWQTIGFAIFGPVMAFLSEKIGGQKKFLIFTMLATSIFSALSAFANSYMSLLIIRFLVGASEGPILALAMTLLAAASAKGKFGRNAGLVNTGVGVIAYIVGPVLITQLITKLDWQWTFILISIPSLILAVMCWGIVKEKQKTSIQQVESGRSSSLKSLFKIKNVIFCILISISCMTAYWIVITFVPIYLVQVSKYSVETMGLIFSTMGIVGIFTAVLLPLISDYIGRKKTLTIFALLAMIAPLSLYLFPTSWAGVAGIVLCGSFLGALVPIYVNIIPEESLPPALITTGSALILGIGEISGSLILGVASRLSDVLGLPFLLLVSAAASCVLAILAVALKETRKKETVEVRELQTESI